MKAAYLKAAFMRSADSLTPNKISNILPHSSPLILLFNPAPPSPPSTPDHNGLFISPQKKQRLVRLHLTQQILFQRQIPPRVHGRRQTQPRRFLHL